MDEGVVPSVFKLAYVVPVYEEVISGVPQGTVLASIFFIIMISDIDENLKNSIVRIFADDTRVSAKIRTKEDMELLQRDLDTIYSWAEENIMEFNEGKFERMSHGKAGDIEEGTHIELDQERKLSQRNT